MKYCTRCKEMKSLDQYNKSSRTGYQRYCRKCQSEHYKSNKDRHSENVRKNEKIRDKQIQDWIWSYLENHPCVDCGETNLLVLDFDHEGNKTKAVMTMYGAGNSLSNIIKEVEKCVVRCANCHRIKTAQQFNTWRWQRLLG